MYLLVSVFLVWSEVWVVVCVLRALIVYFPYIYKVNQVLIKLNLRDMFITFVGHSEL
jgi:hypothetical protein